MSLSEQLDSFRQGLSFTGPLLRPRTLRVTHRITSVNDLPGIASNYDLILLDRDCTLQAFHAPRRDPRFEKALNSIADKCELMPNSSFKGSFQSAGTIFSDLFPVNHLLRFEESPQLLHLYRISSHTLSIWEINPTTGSIRDATDSHKNTDGKEFQSIKKPNPLFVQSVLLYNQHAGRIPLKNPRILFCGDRYLTDIAVGNLSHIDTALVQPVYPFSHPPLLFWNRYLIDKPLGGILSRLA